jgi:hypothetical protein
VHAGSIASTAVKLGIFSRKSISSFELLLVNNADLMVTLPARIQRILITLEKVLQYPHNARPVQQLKQHRYTGWRKVKK